MRLDDVFEIMAPAQWTVPMVFNSPHSGSHIPAELQNQSKLEPLELRISEDAFVDELFGGCVDVGAPLLRALVSRSFVDLNREPYELDPRMFLETLPGFANTGSPRVASGLGTIPRIVSEGLEIYRGRIDLAKALARIDTVYRPYHRALAALLDEAFKATGFVLLVDCHSMPSSAVSAGQNRTARTADVVIGDRFGAASDGEISRFIEAELASAGLQVSRNRPYAGGFITETHGAPRNGRHAVQIELNRALYMNERTHARSRNFVTIKKTLDQLAVRLAGFISETTGLPSTQMAAE